MKEATCSEEGLKQTICTECDWVIKEQTINKKAHKYTVDEEASTDATCLTAGEEVKVCSVCGDTVRTPIAGGHTYAEVTGSAFLKSESGTTATFYKSCTVCKEKSSETFAVQIQSDDQYTPTSPTVTMYDVSTETLSYGFTWNMLARPLDAGVMLKKSGDADYTFYSADSYSSNGVYVCKTVVELLPNTSYTYKFADEMVDVYSEEVSFTSVNPTTTSFSFASFSDSQMSSADGVLWYGIFSKVSDVDFYLHSGDITNAGKSETQWQGMLDTNRSYLMKKPMMVVSGNHEVVDNVGRNNSVYDHFHNNIPTQSVRNGYYYSFVYGNVKFIMLNTNNLMNDKLETAQYEWLVNELQNKTSKWTIVVMHNPLYSIGKYGSDAEYNAPSIGLTTQLNDVFAQHGVDLVLQGHDHAYSKTYPIGVGRKKNVPTQETVDGILYDKNPDGTIYIMTGPAGDQARGEEGSVVKGYYEKYDSGKKQSWAEYTVTDNKLTVSIQYLSAGNVYTWHKFGILKTN